MIELNRRYTFRIPNNTISASGILDIIAFIERQNLCEDAAWLALNPGQTYCELPALPSDWRWVWEVEIKEEFMGNFPTRVRRWYYKRYAIKCPDAFIAEIGNIARRHSESNEVYEFEFVNRIDWEAGDFGDDYSCYWGDNSGARIMLQDNGGMAMLFYNEDGTGLGRAWLVEIDSNLFVIFNGYGIKGDPTLQIARVFAAFMGLSYRSIRLSNRYGYTLYINGNIGYVIGEPSVIAATTSYDFRWDDVVQFHCANCGQPLLEGENFYAPDDNDYCEDCYYHLFESCDHCGEVCDRDDVQYVDSVQESVCKWCLQRDFDTCYECGEYFKVESLHEHEDEQFCWQCLNERTTPPDYAE